MGAADPSSSPPPQEEEPSRNAVPHRATLGPGRRPLDYGGSQGWEARITSRTILAATMGAATGLAFGISRRQNILSCSVSMGANFGIAAASFSGAQELVRELRAADPEDPVNGILGGLASGALLGRLHGGPTRALPAALLFAFVGTTLQVGAVQLREYRIRKFLKSVPSGTNAPKERGWELPEWFPIKKLDEETAKKKALEREVQLQKTIESLNSVEFQADDQRH